MSDTLGCESFRPQRGSDWVGGNSPTARSVGYDISPVSRAFGISIGVAALCIGLFTSNLAQGPCELLCRNDQDTYQKYAAYTGSAALRIFVERFL